MKYENTIKNAHINENFSINTIIDDIIEIIPQEAKRVFSNYGVKNVHANNVMSVLANSGLLEHVEGETLRRSQYKVLKVIQRGGVSKVVMILSHKVDGGKIALKINRHFFTKHEHDNNLIENDCYSQLKSEYEFFKNAEKNEKQYLASIGKYFPYKGVMAVECADYVFSNFNGNDGDKLMSHNGYEKFVNAMLDMERKYGLCDVLGHMSNIGIFNGKIKALDYGFMDRF